MFVNVFFFGYSSFMVVLWLEIHSAFLRLFLLFNSVTSAVTAYNVSVLKKTSDIPLFHFCVIEINSKHQSNFLFGVKVEGGISHVCK